MKKRLIILIFILLILPFASSQESKLSMICSSEELEVGKSTDCYISNFPGNLADRSSYEWSVDGAEIVSENYDSVEINPIQESSYTETVLYYELSEDGNFYSVSKTFSVEDSNSDNEESETDLGNLEPTYNQEKTVNESSNDNSSVLKDVSDNNSNESETDNSVSKSRLNNNVSQNDTINPSVSNFTGSGNLDDNSDDNNSVPVDKKSKAPSEDISSQKSNVQNKKHGNEENKNDSSSSEKLNRMKNIIQKQRKIIRELVSRLNVLTEGEESFSLNKNLDNTSESDNTDPKQKDIQKINKSKPQNNTPLESDIDNTSSKEPKKVSEEPDSSKESVGESVEEETSSSGGSPSVPGGGSDSESSSGGSPSVPGGGSDSEIILSNSPKRGESVDMLFKKDGKPVSEAEIYVDGEYRRDTQSGLSKGRAFLTVPEKDSFKILVRHNSQEYSETFQTK